MCFKYFDLLNVKFLGKFPFKASRHTIFLFPQFLIILGFGINYILRYFNNNIASKMFILSLCLIHIIISLFNFPNYLQKYNLLQNDDELNFVKKELGQNQIKHIFTDRVNILWLKDLDANIYVNKDIEENYELISSDKDKNMVILSNFKSNSYYKKIKKRYNLKLIKVINGKNIWIYN